MIGDWCALGPSLSTDIALSRDGKQALLGLGDIVLLDLARKLPRRLTSNPGGNGNAQWSPDEREVYFLSNREERRKLWKLPIDGSAPPKLVVDHELNINDYSILPSGEIVFSVTDPKTRIDIWLQEPSGTQRALMQTEFDERMPIFSPDGAFLAYVSDVSGSYEVYLIAASGKGVPIQVTNGGGTSPKFSPDGRALLYRKGRNIFQIALQDGKPVPDKTAGEVVQRFLTRNLESGKAYALAPDGNGMLAVQLGDASIPREIRVITDFFDEIERATKKGDKP